MDNPLQHLQCPVCHSSLSQDKENEVVCAQEHRFQGGGRFYHFLSEAVDYDASTEQAASVRWQKTIHIEEDPAYQNLLFEDFLERYGFEDANAFRQYLSGIEHIAEIGAGEGRLVDYFLEYSEANIFALDLSDSAFYLKEKYANEPRVVVIKGDAGHHPFADHSIDLLACEQVPSNATIFSALVRVMKPGSKMIQCVYAKKSPVREKMDRIIRDSIAKLDEEAKYKIADKMTEVGKLLSGMEVNVSIPADFDDFGHLKGREMPLQRFLYYAVMKCFWNEHYTYEKNREFNHDWYCYPTLQTFSLEEVKGWVEANGIVIDHQLVTDANISVRGSWRGK